MRLLFIILFFFAPLASFGAGDTLFVRGANSIGITPYMQHYEDCNEQPDSNILQAHRTGRFSADIKTNQVNEGFTTCTHWFSLKVKNDTSVHNIYLWNFYNDGINFTVFEVDSAGMLNLLGSSSNATPLKERTVPLRSVSFRVNMEPGETKQLFLKTSLQWHNNLYFPTDFSTETDILYYEVGNGLLLGGFYGFFLFALIFNFLVFIILKRRLYGYMFAYILCLLLFSSIEYLYDSYFFSGTFFGFWMRFPKLFFIMLGFLFYSKVFQEFTNHEKRFPAWNRVLNYANAIMLVVAGLFFVMQIVSKNHNLATILMFKIVNTLVILHFILILTNMIFAVARGNRLSGYYLICNSLLFIAFLIYLSNTLGITTIPVFFRPGNIAIGFGVEILALSIAFLLKYRNEFKRFTNELIAGQNQKDRLSLELINAQENERKVIAANLHDGLGNTITALKLLLSQKEAFGDQQIHDVFQLAHRQFRSLIYQIAPEELEREGLYATIQKTLGLMAYSAIRFNVSLMGDDKLLSGRRSINIYHIFQELLNNIINHSKASEVDIFIDSNKDEITFQVEDNGVGFGPNLTEGMGLRNIRARVEFLGGHFHIENARPGTVSTIEIPQHE